jgi:hypothetical protein
MLCTNGKRLKILLISLFKIEKGKFTLFRSLLKIDKNYSV